MHYIEFQWFNFFLKRTINYMNLVCEEKMPLIQKCRQMTKQSLFRLNKNE